MAAITFGLTARIVQRDKRLREARELEGIDGDLIL